MSGSGNDLVVRESAPAGALAIYADQVEWSSMQEAALNQIGLRNASDGDRMVFLHQAQRTGLDPFAKQIHMIERAGKWGIQTGIDGFRVMRARAERKAGVRGILGQAIYVDAEGNEYKRWFKPMPPVGCEITYTVRELTAAGTVDTPYTSYLRFTEYAQYKSDGKLTQKWTGSPAHMLEKCTEADVYRKAFPQDFSGVDLSDAPSAPDEDAPPAQPERQRVTAAQAQASAPQRATAEVIRTGPSPAADGSAETPAAPAEAAGEANHGPSPDDPEYRRAMNAAQAQLKRFITGDTEEELRESRLVLAARILRSDAIGTLNNLTVAELRTISNTCGSATGPDSAAQLEALLTKGEVPGGE